MIRESQESHDRDRVREIAQKCGLSFENPEFKQDVPKEIIPELAQIMIGRRIDVNSYNGGNFSGLVTDVMVVGDREILIEAKEDNSSAVTLEDNYLPGFFPIEFLEPEMTIIFPRPGHTRATVRVKSNELASIFKKSAKK